MHHDVVETVQTQLSKKAKICSVWKVQSNQFVPCGLALVSVQNMAWAPVTIMCSLWPEGMKGGPCRL